MSGAFQVHDHSEIVKILDREDARLTGITDLGRVLGPQDAKVSGGVSIEIIAKHTQNNR
jgi:hypothetical protein